jgi:hypothetical protein
VTKKLSGVFVAAFSCICALDDGALAVTDHDTKQYDSYNTFLALEYNTGIHSTGIDDMTVLDET